MKPSRTDELIQIKIAEQLYGHASAAIAASMVNTVVVGYVFRNIVNTRLLVGWMVASIGFLAFRWGLTARVLKTPFSLENHAKRLRLFGSTIFVSGAIFGAPGTLFISADHPGHNAFIYFLMGGMFAGSLGAFAIDMRVFFLFSAPVFLPVTVRVFLLGGELHTAMGLLGLIFIAMMSVLLLRMNKTLIGAFRLSLQNQRLARRTKNLNQQLLQANEEFRALSLCDSLTRTKNRRFVSDILRFETERFGYAKEKYIKTRCSEHDLLNQIYGVALIDIDFFKHVNDTYGHATGDEVLKGLVERLQGLIRKDDALVRWGGEEFLIVLKRTNPSHLQSFARKLVEAVASTPFRIRDDLSLDITCSLGCAALPFFPQAPRVVGLEQTIDIADRALYRAKHTGRNRAVFARPAPAGDDGMTEERARWCAENLDEAFAKGLVELGEPAPSVAPLQTEWATPA